MNVQESILPQRMEKLSADVLGFDLEMANSFPAEPPVICMIGTEYYDPAREACVATIASITDRAEERALVEWFLGHLRQFGAERAEPTLLTFSGTDNDLPWLADRIRRYGIDGELAGVLDAYTHVDLRQEFRKRTQSDRISLKKLEELFGIERSNELASKKVSFMLTDVLRRNDGEGHIPDKVHHYLGEDVHHLLVIHDRWDEQSLASHFITEFEYLNRAYSLGRLANRLIRQTRRPLEAADRKALQRLVAELHTGLNAAIAAQSLDGFALPPLPELRGAQPDLERLARKHAQLAEIQVADESSGTYRLTRQLDKPLGALALVQDAGKVLFIRRPDHVSRAPGYWGLPGGLVEPGETPAEAAARELGEELGLTGEAVQVLGTRPSISGEYELFWVQVEVPDAAMREPDPDPEEVAELRWVTPADFDALEPMVPGAREGLREFLGGPWAHTGSSGNGPGGSRGNGRRRRR